jgi:predicted RNA-binding Zn-ribbon protein involved in translation (DUF1610 family)
VTGNAASGPTAPHVEVRADGLAFGCPRCGAAVTERFYGPCGPCRRQLVDTLAGEARDVRVDRFEPRLHVTPNAVATRD